MILPKDVQAIIFDMDGVLWQTNSIHKTAYCQVLEPLGISLPDYRSMAGRRTKEVIKELLNSANLEVTADQLDQLTVAKQTKANQLIRLNPPFANSHYSVLSNLAKHYRLALASSSSKGNLQLFFEVSHTAKFFEVALSGEDVICAKPSPEIYLKVLKVLSLRPPDVIVVEDSINGIRSAHSAGMEVIAITGTHEREELLSQPGVIAVIENLEEFGATTYEDLTDRLPDLTGFKDLSGLV